MGRILLILTAGCLFATFMIIANSSFIRPTTSASPKYDEATKKAEKDRLTKREQSARGKNARGEKVYRLRSSASENSEEFSVSVPEPEQGTKPEVGVATVNGDQTPVYSVNSRDSRIIKVLKKGEKVATDVQVIDGQGRWTIVKKDDLTKPGFVLDENLRPATSKKSTENRK